MGWSRARGMAAYATTRQQGSSSRDRATDYHTTLFRRLTWEGTVPLEVRVDSKELPANSNRGLECYYVQAPRVSYLPLLLPEVHKYLMDVVFDDSAATSLKEEDWWFETEEGTLLKWSSPSFLDQSQPTQRIYTGTGPSASYTTTTVYRPPSAPLHHSGLSPSPFPSALSFISSPRPPRNSCWPPPQKLASRLSWANSRRPISSVGAIQSASLVYAKQNKTAYGKASKSVRLAFLFFPPDNPPKPA